MKMFSQNCLNSNFISFCLFQACAPPTIFFKGRCYDICPIRTYAFNYTGDTEDIRIEKINRQDDEELQSIDRKKRSKNMYRNTGDLHKNNQIKFDFQVENIKSISCEPCDKSCLRCYGPLNSQCSICPFGSQLKRMANTNETYCINLSERSSGNAFTNLSTDSLNANLIRLILASLIIVSALVLVFVMFKKGKCDTNCPRKVDNEISTTYSYDRVALFADDDNLEEEIECFNALPPTIKVYTDDNENI